MAPRIPAASLSPRWKAKDRRPFLATSFFLKDSGAAVLVLAVEALVLPVDFFFDEAAFEAFLAVFLEDFVVMVITPLLC
jgi:hypothetical protein